MTRARVPAGSSLAQADALLRRSCFGIPRALPDGKDDSTGNFPVIALTGGVANTPGTWQPVVAALSEDVGFVRITPAAATGTSATNTSALLDIGIGAALSETVVIPSIGVGYATNQGAATRNFSGWMFPIFIPKGTRVAARVAGAEAAKAFSVRVEFFAPLEGVKPSSSIPALGAVTASSRGTLLTTPAAAVPTVGAWTQIVAATAEPYVGLGVSIQGGGDTTHQNANVLVDVGVGAAGNEVQVIDGIALESTSAELLAMRSTLVHPVWIPAGSRVCARWRGSDITGTFDVVLHGIRPPR